MDAARLARGRSRARRAAPRFPAHALPDRTHRAHRRAVQLKLRAAGAGAPTPVRRRRTPAPARGVFRKLLGTKTAARDRVQHAWRPVTAMKDGEIGFSRRNLSRAARNRQRDVHPFRDGARCGTTRPRRRNVSPRRLANGSRVESPAPDAGRWAARSVEAQPTSLARLTVPASRAAMRSGPTPQGRAKRKRGGTARVGDHSGTGARGTGCDANRSSPPNSSSSSRRTGHPLLEDASVAGSAAAPSSMSFGPAGDRRTLSAPTDFSHRHPRRAACKAGADAQLSRTTPSSRA